jgi:hypothetical protein
MLFTKDIPGPRQLAFYRNHATIDLLYLLSGIYLTLAIVKPRYGSKIGSHGGAIRPSTASTISALRAKTIELSFVTVFVAFLEQVVSRNAFKKPGGVSIAHMSMRSWIMQPGTLVTH